MTFHFKKARMRRALGQNFLNNPRIVEKIIAAANLDGTETVLEVGPGFGILTEALLKTGCRVIAIEKDRELFTSLRASPLARRSNLVLIHGDALKIPPPTESYVWIANIPYSITSPLLDHYIRDAACAKKPNLPQRAVLMVQKEVAEKICAKPPHMNVLALHVQAFGAPKVVARVSRHNFNPAPKVDSAVIKIEFPTSLRASAKQSQPDCFVGLQPPRNDIFFPLIHRAFSQKRKMLRATLPPELLQKADIDPRRRPETLTLEEWKRLVR